MTIGDVVGLVVAVSAAGAAAVVVMALSGLRKDLRGLAGVVEQVGATVAEPRVVVVDHRTVDVDSGPVDATPVARAGAVRALGAAPAGLAGPLTKAIALGAGTTSAAQAFRRRRGRGQTS